MRSVTATVSECAGGMKGQRAERPSAAAVVNNPRPPEHMRFKPCLLTALDIAFFSGMSSCISFQGMINYRKKSNYEKINKKVKKNEIGQVIDTS